MNQRASKRLAWWFASSVALFGIALVSITIIQQIERRHRFIEQVKMLGGEVFYRDLSDATNVVYSGHAETNLLGRPISNEPLFVDLSSANGREVIMSCLSSLQENDARIEALVLAGQAVSDDDIQSLPSMKSLRCLDLSNTLIKGTCFSTLASLPKLEILSLKDTPCQDIYLPALAKAQNLRSLDLMGTTISDAALGKLQQSLPLCLFVTDQAKGTNQRGRTRPIKGDAARFP